MDRWVVGRMDGWVDEWTLQEGGVDVRSPSHTQLTTIPVLDPLPLESSPTLLHEISLKPWSSWTAEEAVGYYEA